MKDFYSADFRHFDDRIWQVPTWTLTIFIIVGSLFNKYEYLNSDIGDIILCILVFGVFIFSHVLYRYRHNQTCIYNDISPAIVFGFIDGCKCWTVRKFMFYLGPQSLLQFFMFILFLVAISMIGIGKELWIYYLKLFAIMIALFSVVYYEIRIYAIRNM